ncbi:hypothetical protein Nepgr_032646 [Nepenthes gracilis]|uniref:Uncharacterized protein n=1 Tax=Nepenthes gracilis TaxID=150966 RepID=A0AAD3TKU6_NEPGR|nr:hypothetical protein Nepgr_032646 [Nepenthes gracilis]
MICSLINRNSWLLNCPSKKASIASPPKFPLFTTLPTVSTVNSRKSSAPASISVGFSSGYGTELLLDEFLYRIGNSSESSCKSSDSSNTLVELVAISIGRSSSSRTVEEKLRGLFVEKNETSEEGEVLGDKEYLATLKRPRNALNR